MDWILPSPPNHLQPPPDAKRIEPVLEARYWIELRECLGDLVIYSRLFPDAPDVFEYTPRSRP